MNRNAPSQGNWNQNGRNDAQALINAITFSFIVTLVIVRHILDLTRPLTVRLQKETMDLLKGKEEIVLLKSALTGMQTDLNTRHHALYEEVVTLARRVSVQPRMPRIVKRQVHRNNAWEKIVGDYFHSMRLDDMDYSAMREVYNLVRNRQGKSIDRFIDRYNETYFRELVLTLEDRAGR